jgi:hypothetical protein
MTCPARSFTSDERILDMLSSPDLFHVGSSSEASATTSIMP